MSFAASLVDTFSVRAGQEGPAGLMAQTGQFLVSTFNGAVATVRNAPSLLSKFNFASGLVKDVEPIADLAEKAAPALSRIALPAALAAGTVETAEHAFIQHDDRSAAASAGYTAGGIAGAFAGAAVGGAIGSVVPVVGTAVGAAVGGIIGAFGTGALVKAAALQDYDALTMRGP